MIQTRQYDSIAIAIFIMTKERISVQIDISKDVRMENVPFFIQCEIMVKVP